MCVSFWINLLSLDYRSPLNSFLREAKHPHLLACRRDSPKIWDMAILSSPICPATSPPGPFHLLWSTSVPSTLKMPLSRVTPAVAGFVLLGCPHSLVLMTTLSFWKPLFPQGCLNFIPILTIPVLILPHQMPSPHSLPQTFRGNWHCRQRLVWVFFFSSLMPLKYLCLSSKTRALNNFPQTT